MMKKLMVGKRALSPLLATILLLVFALVIGTITINWGRTYVEQIQEDPAAGVFDSAIIISIEDVDTPLKQLQLQFITGKISEQEYREKEQALI